MNFFKSVFADEPDSESEALASESKNQDDSGSDSDERSKSPSDEANSESAPVASSGWDFGGLIKTLATKSESVIDTYKRDLQEFSTGLKAETAVLREVANKAVKELPKAGVSTFDELKTTVLKGTTQIISQGKEVLQSLDQEISSPAAAMSGDSRSINYSRFDARLKVIQIDKETYCLEPEDLDDYQKWKSGFVLEEKGEELGKLFEENAAMENIYHKIVPSEIDPETFWNHYFYKVHKLKQAEEVRASFLKKAIDDEEEEELSWDMDEGSDDDNDSKDSKGEGSKVREAIVSENDKMLDKSESVQENVIVEVKKDMGGDGEISKEAVKIVNVAKESQDGDSAKVGDKIEETSNVNEKVEDTLAKEENKPAPEPVELEKEVKGKSDESASKVEVGTTTEEDLEWDEIEDEGSDGEKPVAPRKSHDKAELQKRLSSAAEDEDLSWDIEDDDEPVKP
ncbi:hypothetical protein QQ045_003588 [Rhodiola kirilowii]